MVLDDTVRGTHTATGAVLQIAEDGDGTTPKNYNAEFRFREFQTTDKFKFTVEVWDRVTSSYAEQLTKLVTHSEIKSKHLNANKNDYLENLLHIYRLDGDFVDEINADNGTIAYDANFKSWWKFEDSLTDEIGTQNLSVVSGSAGYVDTPFGRGLDFTADYFAASDTPYDRDINQALSIEFWIDFDSLGTDMVVIAKGTAFAGTGYYVYKDTANNIVFRINTNTPQTNVVASTTVVAANTWYHVVCTFSGNSDRNGMKIYINGVLEATGTAQAMTGSALNNDNFTVGAETDGGVQLDGQMTHARFYTAELTASQATELYRKNFKTNFHNGIGRKAFHSIGFESTTLSNETNFDYERDRQISWSFWYRVPSGFTAFHGIISKATGSNGWGVHGQSGNIYLLLRNTLTTNELSVRSTGTVNDDKWHFITITYNGNSAASGVKFYIDGIQSTTVTVVDALSASILNNTIPVIGGIGGNLSEGVQQIQDVRIYDEELSQGKVTAIHEATKGFYPAQTHIKFDGDVIDSGLLGKNGTWTGTEIYGQAKVGSKSGYFNGNSYITFNQPSNQFHRFEHNQPFTISAWFRAKTGITVNDIITAKANLADTIVPFFICSSNSNTTITFRMRGNGDPTSDVVSSTITLDTWHHIVCTFSGNSDRSGMKIYLDGVLSSTGASQAFTGTIANVESMRIASQPALSRIWDGNIDDLKVFWYEMSADEVAQLYGKTQRIFIPIYQAAKFRIFGQLIKGAMPKDLYYTIYEQ